MEKSKKHFTPSEIKQKIYAFCAYQERSHQEVKNKLYSLGLYSSEVDEMMTTLITDGYLNEERFAKSFAGGKFRIKHWGRVKIVRELESRGLTKNCIRSGMGEINDEDYLKTLTTLLKKKAALTKDKDPFVRRDKLARFAMGKGFESEIVWKVVNDLVKK